MSIVSKLTEQWENFVNSFLFANFKTLEIWIAKRGVSDNKMFFNYIKFPKAENGKQANEHFIKYIIQSIEADDSVCRKIFGPQYIKGSAEIEDDGTNISIIWNKILIQDFIDNTKYDEDPDEQKRVRDLYYWDINEEEKLRPKAKSELSRQEIKRREKIDRILRLIALECHNPKMMPENRDPENLEEVYTKYNWEESKYWDEIDDPKKQVIKWEYSPKLHKYTMHNLLTTKWFNEKTGKWEKQ